MRKLTLLALVCLTLWLAPLVAARSDRPATQPISSDPYTNPDSQHMTQVEPDNFAYGNTVVAAFQSGRFYDGGASNNGWATSADGGQTYSFGFLPGTTVNSNPPGPYARLSDPSTAYDARHDVWLIASLALKGAYNDIIVSRSTDGGLTWGNPIVVANSPANFYDKEWIVCDNSATSSFYGHCYITWEDAAQGSALFMSTSTNGGLTWSAKATPRNGASGLGGQPVVQPGGRVIVPFTTGSSLYSFFSIYGGARWTSIFYITNQVSHTPAGNLRSYTILPSAAIDDSGKVYVAWSDCRFRAGCTSNDIVMSTSSNGRLWSEVVRIPIDPTTSSVDHFIPGLAAAGSGATARLALTYYYYPEANCTAATCQLLVGFTSSADGGATWSTPQTLGGPMNLSWIANTNQGRMVGDYVSTALVGDMAVSVFSLADAPIGGVFQQAIWSATNPVLAGGSYPLAVQPDPVLSTQGDAWLQTQPAYRP